MTSYYRASIRSSVSVYQVTNTPAESIDSSRDIITHFWDGHQTKYCSPVFSENFDILHNTVAQNFPRNYTSCPTILDAWIKKMYLPKCVHWSVTSLKFSFYFRFIIFFLFFLYISVILNFSFYLIFVLNIIIIFIIVFFSKNTIIFVFISSR